jgi:hypothetical protein
MTNETLEAKTQAAPRVVQEPPKKNHVPESFRPLTDRSNHEPETKEKAGVKKARWVGQRRLPFFQVLAP